MINRMSRLYIVAALLLAVLYPKDADACAIAKRLKGNYGAGMVSIWYITYYTSSPCETPNRPDPPTWKVTNYIWGSNYNSEYRELQFITPNMSPTFDPDETNKRADFNAAERAAIKASTLSQFPQVVQFPSTKIAEPSARYNCFAALYGDESVWIDAYILIMFNYLQVSSVAAGATTASHGWVGMDITAAHGTARLIDLTYTSSGCPPGPITVQGYEGKYGVGGKYLTTKSAVETYASGDTRYHIANPAVP